MKNPISLRRAGNGVGGKLAVRALATFAVLLTLSVLVYTGENSRGHQAWAEYKERLIKRGVELDLRKLAPPKVPDDQNFAMTPFLAPLYNLNPKPLQPGQSLYRDTNGADRAMNFVRDVSASNSIWLSVLRGDAGEARTATATRVLQALEGKRAVLDELRTASRRPASRFNLDYAAEDPASIMLPHLGVLNGVATVLRLRAAARLALNQTEGAFDDADLLIRLAQTIHDEPTIVSQLVRFRILGRAQELMADGLAAHAWSDAQLSNLVARLENIALVKDMGKALQAERGAFGNGCFELIRRRPGALSDFAFGEDADPALATYFAIAPSGRIDQEQIAYQRFFDEMVWPGIEPDDGVIHPKIIDDNTVKTTNMLDSLLSCWWNNTILLRVLGTSFRPCLQKTALAQTAVDETATACALERFRMANGKYPATLEALVPRFMARVPDDVVTGTALKYRLAADGKFILYSIGWNEKDDGGTPGADLAKGDWVWPKLPEQ